MTSQPSVDNYPSLLWVAIPPVILISAYYVRKWYLARRLRVHGIGKGAPGFQTSVKRIRITPEIAARIRRGEEVSPEEIEAASRKADLEPKHKEQTKPSGSTSIGSDFGLGRGAIEERDDRNLINGSEKEEVNEWLPESITKPGKRKRRLK